MRNWKFNVPFIQEEIIQKYNPDVFISSYTYSKLYWNSEEELLDIQEVIDTYQPKNYIFRSDESIPEFSFKDNRRECIGRDYSIRQLQGWYTNSLVLNLFDFNKYDFIIKLRTDIGVKNFNIQKQKLVIPAWKYHPGPCDAESSYVDYLAYGVPEAMKTYFNLYNKMQQMHDENLADISLGETLLKEYLDLNKLQVTLDHDIDWILRGEKWASEKSRDFPL
jgi:hypothetical protein